jgi:hypothetical protein
MNGGPAFWGAYAGLLLAYVAMVSVLQPWRLLTDRAWYRRWRGGEWSQVGGLMFGKVWVKRK